MGLLAVGALHDVTGGWSVPIAFLELTAAVKFALIGAITREWYAEDVMRSAAPPAREQMASSGEERRPCYPGAFLRSEASGRWPGDTEHRGVT
jgi:hypothetical protein